MEKRLLFNIKGKSLILIHFLKRHSYNSNGKTSPLQKKLTLRVYVLLNRIKTKKTFWEIKKILENIYIHL